MKIQKVIIYGFGKWVDFSLDFKTNTMICVVGANESGKSTIHQFILFVLFGFPPKLREFYRPKTSGRMGGRIVVSDDQLGTYTIERIHGVKNGAATCYLENGEIMDEDWLNEQLHGMTETVFQGIFHFSAIDLYELEQINKEDLSDVLLEMSLTGSNQLHTLERKLDNDLGQLFKPSGKIPALNKQFNKLDSLFEQLTAIKNKEEEYSHIHTKSLAVEKRINQIKDQLIEEKQNKRLQENLLQALPIIFEYHELKDELKQYSNDHLSFPIEGMTRLRKLKDNILTLESELTVITTDLNRTKQTYIYLNSFLEEIKPQYTEAEKLNHKKDSYVANVRQLDYIKKSIDKLSTEIEVELNKLNLNLSIQELVLYDFPFYLEEQWSDIHKKVESMNQAKLLLQEEMHTLKEQANKYKYEIEQLNYELLPVVEIKKIQKTLEENKYYEETHLRNEEHKKRKLKWEKTKKRQNRNTFVVSMAALFTLSLIYFTIENTFKPYILYLLPMILIMVLWQWYEKSKANKMVKQLFYEQNSNLNDKSVLSEEEIISLEHQITNNEIIQKQIDILQDQLHVGNIELKKLKEKEKTHNKEESQLDSLINKQHKKYPFLMRIDIQFWPKLLQQMIYILKLYEQKNELTYEHRNIAEQVAWINYQLQQFLIQLNKESFIARDFINEHVFNEIDSFVSKYEQKELQYKSTKETLKRLKKKNEEIMDSLIPYKKEMKKLFANAYVKTEEEFYQASEAIERKKALEASLKKATHYLNQTLSEQARSLVKETRFNKLEIEENLDEFTIRIKKLENELKNNEQLLSELTYKLKALEKSEEYSLLLHQYEMEKEKLNAKAKRWTVLKTAQQLLHETKKSYLNKFVPKIINQTSNYFSILTNGAYKKVFEPVAGSSIYVESMDGMQYEVKELSKGTVDQLYISLRLAMSEWMSEKYQIPFIIDDAFVYFDKLRLKRMALILEEMSKQRQIIYFTCNKEMLSYFNHPSIYPLEKKSVQKT